ncbi:hypothetical protein Tco_1166998 [Tanacetum coccineum]
MYDDLLGRRMEINLLKLLYSRRPNATTKMAEFRRKSVNKGTGVSLGVPDVPTYGSEDEQISWKSSDEDDDDEIESDNDGDDFVHPKFPTHDEEDKKEEWSDDKAYDEVTQGGNVEKEKMDEEKTNEKDEINELYSDVNINMERRDTKMTDAPQTNVQATQASFPKCSTLFQIQFEDRVKSLENDFSEFKQTNLFAEAVSSILGIVDKYLSNQRNEAVKAAVQLYSDRLREEAQAENQDFINKINENMKKIIKDQVKGQVKGAVSKICQD